MPDADFIPSPFLSLCLDFGLNPDKIPFLSHIELWADPILAWIPSKLPDYTDHGKLHSENVLNQLIILCEQYPITFNEGEKYLLSLAAKLHDVGCVINREKHHKHSLKLINEYIITDLHDELGVGLTNCLKQIIISHTKKYNFNHVIKYQHDEIRLDLLCALFRLADALDQTMARVSPTLFNILKKENILGAESQEIWEAHSSIKKIIVDGTNITIFIDDFVYSDIILRNIDDELTSINNFLNKSGYETFERIIRTEEITHPLEEQPDDE